MLGQYYPGISSGVLCVIFGIYEKLLDSILHFFKDIKKNTKFLFPIILGGVIGILIFSNLLTIIFEHFPQEANSIFVGLILGSIPSLIKEVNSKSKFKFCYLFFTLFAFLIGYLSVILEKNISSTVSANYNILYLVLSGFLMSVGVVVPGVSSTIILMLLGIYSNYLSAISSLYLPFLIPLGIGLLAGCLVFMKFTKLLLERFYAPTFFAIIGFTLGSLLILVPTITFDFTGLICLLCILCGFSVARLF